MIDYYHIICLKRSTFADSNSFDYLCDWWKHCHIVYWRPDRAGYTYIESEAGLYEASDLVDCSGEGLDWMLMRVPRGEEE